MMTVFQMLRACGCLSLAALVGACAASEGDENNVAAGALNVIVAPDADGSLPPDLWIGCKNGPTFQVSDLDEVVPLAEGDPGGAADAIAPFLDSGEGDYWPQDGWLILRHAPDGMLLVHDGADEFSFIELERAGAGWSFSGAQSGGPCPLHYLVPEGFNPVDWRLDPQHPASAETMSLSLLVRERSCASGQALGDRLRGPQVVMTEDALRIAFVAVPPSGEGQDCPSNPEAPVTVDLPKPLGDRVVMEGLAIGIDLADFLP